MNWNYERNHVSLFINEHIVLKKRTRYNDKFNTLCILCFSDVAAGGLFSSSLFYTTFPVHFKTSRRYDCLLMSYKKVMRFEDQKNR